MIRTFRPRPAPSAHRLPAATALVAVALAAHGAPAAAQSAVYRCEGESGAPTYQNAPGGKNCRRLDMQSLTTIPAPPPRAAQAGARSAGAASATATASSSPSAFPKVDGATQKSRDSDRRRILEDELRREEGKLDSLRAEFNNGEPERRGDERNFQKYTDRVAAMRDEITRSELNVSSLKRELAGVRD